MIRLFIFQMEASTIMQEATTGLRAQKLKIQKLIKFSVYNTFGESWLANRAKLVKYKGNIYVRELVSLRGLLDLRKTPPTACIYHFLHRITFFSTEHLLVIQRKRYKPTQNVKNWRAVTNMRRNLFNCFIHSFCGYFYHGQRWNLNVCHSRN